MARDSDVQGAVGQPGGELEAASLLGAEGFRHPQVSVVVPLQSEAVETSPQENGAPVSQLTDSVVAAYPAWARRPAHPCGRMAPPVPHGSPYCGPLRRCGGSLPGCGPSMALIPTVRYAPTPSRRPPSRRGAG